MIRIKHILNDLVEYTYPDDPDIEKYKKFYVSMVDKNLKSKHGHYKAAEKKIEIFNLYRADAAIVATTIHELAHHIDHCQRNTSAHDQEFYKVFQQLLFRALDMTLFNKEEFLDATRDASDSNKIAMMIQGYIPRDAGYKNNISVISVKDAFQHKDILKDHGYYWNNVNKLWEKECPHSMFEKEVAFIKKLGLSYSRHDPSELTFNKKSYIIAGKGSYEIRNELKASGFHYMKKEKEWKKEGSMEECEHYSTKYPSVTWRFE